MKHVMMLGFLGIAVLFTSLNCAGQDSVIVLPKPVQTGGMPLMDALKIRKSQRNLSSEKLSDQTVSNLLWAAWGITREDGRRTAPSARNAQEIDIYILMESGAYLFDAKTHTLKLQAAGDHRDLAGKQEYPKKAAMTLVYVVNYSKQSKNDKETKKRYAAVDTGFISQNVYLFCASENLGTVILGMIDAPAIAKRLNLTTDQEVMYTQPVGKLEK